MRRWIYLGAMVLALWGVSMKNFLFFHTAVEFMAIFTAFFIALLGLSTRSFAKNKLFAKLGSLYLFVGVVDFFHTLAFKGMGVFPHFTANEPTQLWILGRSVEVLGLLLLFAAPNLSLESASVAFALSSALGVWSVFEGVFPDCFVEGEGLTTFKVVSEYALVAVVVLLLARLKSSEEAELVEFRGTLFPALLFTALAELSFTLYEDVYGFYIVVGHLFRFLSYYTVFEGLLLQALLNPVRVLSSQLLDEKRRYEVLAYLDQLTGLENRHFFNRWVEEMEKDPSTFERNLPVALVLLDVDGFKSINDTYGHVQGDAVLAFVGRCIRSSVRRGDLAVRFGGDEFLLVLPNCSEEQALEVVVRIQSDIRAKNSFPHAISLSFGVASLASSDCGKLRDALIAADKALYEMKRSKGWVPRVRTG